MAPRKTRKAGRERRGATEWSLPHAPRPPYFFESTETHVLCSTCGKEEPVQPPHGAWYVGMPAGWLTRIGAPAVLAQHTLGALVVMSVCSIACADDFDEAVAEYELELKAKKGGSA